jgi:anti-sigma factor RsiW
MERLSHNHPDHVSDLLSAYIDDAVDLGERHRAASYIETCAACAEEVRELRMFRELLRDLPNVQPRRSFTLDPATVAPPRRLLFPTLRWASLVATLLFVVVLGVDTLAVNRNAGLRFSTASAPGAAQQSPAGPLEGGGSGAAETMMLPVSPAASAAEVGQGSAGASASPVAEQLAPTAVIAGGATTTGETGASAGGTAPQTLPYPPPAVAGGSAPDMGGNAPSYDSSGATAGGTTGDQIPQSALRTHEPAGADTTELDPSAAQGSWWSSGTLRFAEVGLGLIALLLGIAALWSWQRQV